MKVKLNEAKAKVLSFFDVEKLVSFVYIFSETFIGKTTTGTATTLQTEMGEVVKLIGYAYMTDNVNYALYKGLITSTGTESERSAHNNYYALAARKILWLNTVAKGIQDNHPYDFVIQKINLADNDEVREFIDAFMYIVTNYDVIVTE